MIERLKRTRNHAGLQEPLQPKLEVVTHGAR
jgi:hypothetical protein